MRRLGSLLFVVGLGMSLVAGCTVETKASDIICVHDQTDICTDCKQPEGDTRPYRGRHTCASDGKSFGECRQCAPIEDEDKPVTPSKFEPVQGGPTQVVPIDDACNDKLTLVAGKAEDKAPFVYAAVLHEGAFTILSSSGAPMMSPGAFVVSGRSLMGVYRTVGNKLVTSTFVDGLWAEPFVIPDLRTDAPPAIAGWGGKNKLVVHAPPSMLTAPIRSVEGHYTMADWDVASRTWSAPSTINPVTAIDETTPRRSAPTLAAFGVPGVSRSRLIVGFTDSLGGLFSQESNDGVVWKTPFKSTAVAATQPTLLVPMNGGNATMLSVWIGSDGPLYFATRTTIWSGATLASDAIRPLDVVTGVGLSNGRALLVYRDSEKKGWFTLYDPSKETPWSEPKELVRDDNPTLASTPQVVTDTCGAEATLAYAEEGGKVAIMRFAKDAWDTPVVVPGITDVTYVTPALVH